MFRRHRKPSDFGAEIDAHLQLEVDRLREQGLSEAEARAAARCNFGNLTSAQERFYELRRYHWGILYRKTFASGCGCSPGVPVQA